MRRIRLFLSILGILAVAAVSCYALIGCGHHSPSYVGQWLYSGMGSTILNLRSDGTFSETHWLEVDVTFGHAYKGTFTFEPVSESDQNHGTLHLHYTHQYNDGDPAWTSLAATFDEDPTCAIVPETSLTLDLISYAYYGPEAPIPASF